MRKRFDYTLLDPDEPFEIDAGNRPHLFKHAPYEVEDLYDVWTNEPVIMSANEGGPADWLLVGPIPGKSLPLVIPLAPPRSNDPTRCRPIGIYEATMKMMEAYEAALAGDENE